MFLHFQPAERETWDKKNKLKLCDSWTQIYAQDIFMYTQKKQLILLPEQMETKSSILYLMFYFFQYKYQYFIYQLYITPSFPLLNHILC